MAKDKKQQQGFNPRKALKYFTKVTCSMILNDLEQISLDDLIDGLYIHNKDNDKELEYLIREYEKQLLLAKMQPDKFRQGLHEFFMTTSDYLKKNNQYEKFYKLVILSYTLLLQKEQDAITLSYFNLLVQQNSYLTGTSKKIPYGLSKKKGLLITDEVGDYLTEINYEIHDKALKINKMPDLLKVARKYGYNFNDVLEFDELTNYDRLANNMLFLNAYFINDDNSYLLPKPYRNLGHFFKSNIIFYQRNNLNIVREKLLTRQDLLPSKGVQIKLKNCYDIIEMYLEETIRDEKVYLLYKVKFIDNTYLLGFYDVEEMLSSFTFDTGESAMVMQYIIEKLVLQNYINLTCDLTIEEREQMIDFVEHDHDTLPVMIYSKKEISTNGNSEHFRVFNRSEYRAELKGIKGYIRKLPVGATASDEAKENARKLGIELRRDETFVTDFIKKVYKKGDIDGK